VRRRTASRASFSKRWPQNGFGHKGLWALGFLEAKIIGIEPCPREAL
jgi:hypothetical protein